MSIFKRVGLAEIVTVILCIALAIATFIMPTGLPGLVDKVNEAVKQASNKNFTEGEEVKAKQSLIQAQHEFDKNRTFELYYGDTEKLYEVLNNVKGLEIKRVVAVDPSSFFKDVSTWDYESEAHALRYEVIAPYPAEVLELIKRLQLPLYSVEIEYPNTVKFTFLTGKEVL